MIYGNFVTTKVVECATQSVCGDLHGFSGATQSVRSDLHSFTSDSQSPCCTEQKCHQRKRELNYRKLCEVQAFAILILNHLAPFLNYEL